MDSRLVYIHFFGLYLTDFKIIHHDKQLTASDCHFTWRNWEGGRIDTTHIDFFLHGSAILLLTSFDVASSLELFLAAFLLHTYYLKMLLGSA